jgi:hypothetical protein
MVLRPALLHGAECWPTKKSHLQRMKVAEMRMIRWICGHMRLDKISNEVIMEFYRGRKGTLTWCLLI